MIEENASQLKLIPQLIVRTRNIEAWAQALAKAGSHHAECETRDRGCVIITTHEKQTSKQNTHRHVELMMGPLLQSLRLAKVDKEGAKMAMSAELCIAKRD